MSDTTSNRPAPSIDLATLRDSLRYGARHLADAGFPEYSAECRKAADLINPAPANRRRVTCMDPEGRKLYLVRAIDEDEILWEDVADNADEVPPIIAQWLAAQVGGEVEEAEP